MSNEMLYLDAASRLVKLLPTEATLSPNLVSPGAKAAGDTVVASFVGAVSADLAITIADKTSVGADPEGASVSLADVLAPALEEAAKALGAGTIGDLSTPSSSDLFADPDSAVFELSDRKGVVAWFAIRVRDNGVAPARRAGDDAAVAGKLSRINDVEMNLTVEIGRTRLPVRDVLGLEPGTVVELDRSAGAPADILLNGRLIAYGEVVVVDQDYAVRVTRIIDPVGVIQ